MSEPDLPPAIFLMGPTASGKSELAVQLAEKLNSEIISVDSVLVYKGMDIGTAKPSIQERAGIPHYLIDILDPSEAYSTGSFRTAALELMADISSRGKVPILVGGTMLYFNALLKGLAVLPEANVEVRKKLDDELLAKGKQAMYQRLQKIDPESAERIHPNDPQRIQRALEVYELSGRPISDFFHQAQSNQIPYRKIKCIIASEDRKKLHEKIAKRFRLMVDNGLVDEVNELFERGDLSEDLPAIRAVGYRQTWAYLKQQYSLETMTEKGIIATRQLAKRQYTWLRKETNYMHFNADEMDKGLADDLYNRVNSVI